MELGAQRDPRPSSAAVEESAESHAATGEIDEGQAEPRVVVLGHEMDRDLDGVFVQALTSLRDES